MRDAEAAKVAKDSQAATQSPALSTGPVLTHQPSSPAPANTGTTENAGKNRDEAKVVQACTMSGEYGTISLSPGNTVKILGTTGDQVLVRFGSHEGKIPAASTDLPKKH